MKLLTLTILMFLLYGCGSSSYTKFYKPILSEPFPNYVETLKEDEEPLVITSTNLQEDIYSLSAKGYIKIGYSSFNGKLEDVSNAKKKAKELKSNIVLVTNKFTNSHIVTTPIFVPNRTTTYNSGNTSIYGSGGSLYGSYSGTSTSLSTNVIPITSTVQRFDQVALFFVKDTRKLKFGIYYRPLSNKQRAEIGRNTGINVDVVRENSPAYFANLMRNDILIKIGHKEIRNGVDFDKAVTLLKTGDETEITVIRNGLTKQLQLTVN